MSKIFPFWYSSNADRLPKFLLRFGKKKPVTVGVEQQTKEVLYRSAFGKFLGATYEGRINSVAVLESGFTRK